MKTKNLLLVSAAAVAIGAAGTAQAALTLEFVKPTTVMDGANPTTIGGTAYTTWAMQITLTGGTDWTTSTLQVELTQGSLYNNAIGGDGAFNELLLPSFPDLRYDTRLLAPSGNPAFTETPVVQPSPVVRITDQELAAGWFDTEVSAPGTYTIAYLTLSNDANGSIAGQIFDQTGNVAVAFGPGTANPYVIRNGAIVIPEPASLALLGLGGLALLRRR